MTAESFPGFPRNRYTPVPDLLFDELMPRLTNDELRVLLYVIRRTEGFKRATDDISLSQFTEGIVRQDGTVLDHGTGLSRSAAARGLKGLVAMGVLIKQRNRDPQHGHLATTYAVHFEGTPYPTGGPGYTTRETTLVPPVDSQETVPQETANGQVDSEALERVWLRTTDLLRQRMNATNYQTWIVQTRLVALVPGGATIEAPAHQRQGLERLERLLCRALSDASGQPINRCRTLIRS